MFPGFSCCPATQPAPSTWAVSGQHCSPWGGQRLTMPCPHFELGFFTGILSTSSAAFPPKPCRALSLVLHFSRRHQAQGPSITFPQSFLCPVAPEQLCSPCICTASRPARIHCCRNAGDGLHGCDVAPYCLQAPSSSSMEHRQSPHAGTQGADVPPAPCLCVLQLFPCSRERNGAALRLSEPGSSQPTFASCSSPNLHPCTWS